MRRVPSPFLVSVLALGLSSTAMATPYTRACQSGDQVPSSLYGASTSGLSVSQIGTGEWMVTATWTTVEPTIYAFTHTDYDKYVFHTGTTSAFSQRCVVVEDPSDEITIIQLKLGSVDNTVWLTEDDTGSTPVGNDLRPTVGSNPLLVVVQAKRGNDVIHGSDAPGDELYEVLVGGSDADVIYGNRGDDCLIGGQFVTPSFTAGYTTWRQRFEDLCIPKSSPGSYPDLADDLDGGPGDDILAGGEGDDTMAGGCNDDTLFGDLSPSGPAVSGDDTMDGDGGSYNWTWAEPCDGADTLFGELGADIMDGQGGSDDLHGNEGDDVIHGGEGNDTLDGGDDRDQLYGDAGSDTIDGAGDVDYLYAGVDDDSGDDPDDQNVLRGGDGDDWLYGAEGKDLLLGEADADHLYGRTNDDLLSGGDGNDYLEGGYGNDELAGGDGDDDLYGGQDDDILCGGMERDLYVGGTGADHLLHALSGVDANNEPLYLAETPRQSEVAQPPNGPNDHCSGFSHFQDDLGSVAPFGDGNAGHSCIQDLPWDGGSATFWSLCSL
ncbi:MAG: hypothetical protein H6733_04905 [Alphaproteobacteria bacterium]|nr:hypothetical protein [Alphaproteobacteria bacterium]